MFFIPDERFSLDVQTFFSVLQKVSFNFVWKQDENQKNDTNAKKKKKNVNIEEEKYVNTEIIWLNYVSWLQNSM